MFLFSLLEKKKTNFLDFLRVFLFWSDIGLIGRSVSLDFFDLLSFSWLASWGFVHVNCFLPSFIKRSFWTQLQ